MIKTNFKNSYTQDFYAWALQNAKLMRENKFSEIDVENIAEELESMGRSDKRELLSRFAILMAHLLKWKFQPERRGNSWKYTIAEQRFELADLLEESPSLKHTLDLQLEHAYQKALLIAIKETGMSRSVFSTTAPFNLQQCLDGNFLPE